MKSLTGPAASRSKSMTAAEDVAHRVAGAADGVGRDQPRHQVHGDEAWRVVERPVAAQPVERRALERAEGRRARHPPPEVLERSAGGLAAADGHAMGEDRGVHRAGRGAGDRLDLDPGLLQQPVEHAPGQGAVRSAALQRQVDQQRFSPCGFLDGGFRHDAQKPLEWRPQGRIGIAAAGHRPWLRRRLRRDRRAAMEFGRRRQ